MADNLRFGEDVKNYYLQIYGLTRITEYVLKDHTDHYLIEKDRPAYPFNNDELVVHLDTCKDILADRFNTFCKGHVPNNYSSIPVKVAAGLLESFYKIQEKEMNRIKEYQESRPDLYD